MHRFALLAALVAAGVVWVGGSALAQTDEFQLPPVKLKPDRPTTAKPIPPTPDDREAPKETPPAETPKETPPSEKPMKGPEKAPPVVAKPAEPPAKTPPVVAKPPEPPPALPAKPVDTEAPKTPQEPTVTPADLPMPVPPKIEEPKPELPPVLAMPAQTETPKVTDVRAETAEAQVTPTVEMDLSGLGEVGIVEEVARSRKAYERALLALKDYYIGRGTQHKIEWINTEIDAFNKVPRVQYLIVAELAGPGLRPSRRIEAADQLYTEGIHYKEYPALPPGKKDYLKVALEKFTTIIQKYPESDKIDDAAFRMGEIYGGWYFEDWARAVQSYERCWQWHPKTEYPAYLNAAKIYEEKLKNSAKAVELYNRVIAESQDENQVRQAEERIRALTGK